MPSKALRFLIFTVCSSWALLAQNGVVTGTVFDAQTSRPIVGVKISINGQSAGSSTTDTSGAFRFDLSPGKYTFKFTSDAYQDVEVTDIEVRANEAVDASTVMATKEAATVVNVEEKISNVAASAEAMLTERKLAAQVSDSLSREELRNSTASDAARAVEKVTGVSVVDNGYVYVRGLGERYSATMLNSAMIPTTEPEKRVVPLDLFPAALIDNIKILKTYTPDLPGEFAGGLVQMQTVEFPNKPTLQVSVNVGFNDRTSFRRFADYPGGDLDFFGFDDGTRGIPNVIPRNRRIGFGENPQTVQQYGRAFSNNWEPVFRDSVRPQQSYNMVAGATFGKLGVVGALTFSNKPLFQSELQNYWRPLGAGGSISLFASYPDFRAYTRSARLGGVLNLAYKLNNSNKLVLRNTITRDTDNEARVFEGTDFNQGTIIRSERLRYIERGLISTSLEGEHAVAKLRNLLLKWQFTYSNSSRDEPDLREVLRGQDETGRFSFIGSGQSGFRFFNNLEDRIYEPQVELSQPFYRGNISGLWKVGFRGTFRSRDFAARRFRFFPNDLRGIDIFAPSNQLFRPENINPTQFRLLEETRGTDRYDASMDVYGGFAMLDVGIGSKWRLVGGLRVEDANIRVVTADQFNPGVPFIASLVNRDPLPAINAIYALSPRQNLRIGYSQTLSRPDFRELSPFEFTNVVGGYNATGNPNLVRAKIDNIDARWEWFLGGNQIIAASFFWKEFDRPVESSVEITSDFRQTFINALGASNRGFELEFRKGLAFVNRKLSDFALQSNFTFVDSSVDIGENAVLTSRTRPLVGQSRFIYNVIAEWNKPRWRSQSRFYVNSVSRRITDVGVGGLPDIYQERNNFVDFVYQYSFTESGRANLKFNAENLLDNTYKWTQADQIFRRFQIGRTFSIGLSYSIF